MFKAIQSIMMPTIMLLLVLSITLNNYSYASQKEGFSATLQSADEDYQESNEKTDPAAFSGDADFPPVRIPEIYLGEPTPSDDYKWQVALIRSDISNYNKAHFCGGTIISDNWVVTAAHCVKDKNVSDFVVLAGSNDLTSTKGKMFEVARIINHQKYNEKTKDYDISLLNLKEPIPSNIGSPIQLAPKEYIYDPNGLPLTVSGWGDIEFLGESSSTLLGANVYPIDNDVCNRNVNHQNRITENMLCAGKLLGGEDACTGDSGGPLVTSTTPRYLVGIVSWGVGCGFAHKPGVYTKITKFSNWVSDKINK
jgi:secreted trypsin-like serine protease